VENASGDGRAGLYGLLIGQAVAVSAVVASDPEVIEAAFAAAGVEAGKRDRRCARSSSNGVRHCGGWMMRPS
jgi:hypothetical protein